MTHPAAILAGLAMAAAMAVPAHAGDGEAFVSAFAEACVPERLSYAGTLAHVERIGWTGTDRDADPELASMMARSDAALAATETQSPEIATELRLFTRTVENRPLYLVVGRSSAVVTNQDEPWVFTGCYLYDFAASAPIGPEAVTKLVDRPVAYSVSQGGVTGHVWGPPCAMPRTGDVYLAFVEEGSPAAGETGFSGLMLKFDTSEPGPDEVVPATYC